MTKRKNNQTKLTAVTITIFVIAFWLIPTVSCNEQPLKASQIDTNRFTIDYIRPVICPEPFERTAIRAHIQKRIEQKEALYVHIFVPLCDDIHQGIIPTGNSLGDGMNLRTNLYWGAGYGIKTHFRRKSDWALIHDTFDVNEDILERVVFKKQFPQGHTVYITADAYRGDRMYECVRDYLESLAGKHPGYVHSKNDTVKMKSNADLLLFNGHNGLFDVWIEPVKSADYRRRDAVAVACVSSSFTKYYRCTRSYPLVVTLSLLPPEAYLAEALINTWAVNEPDTAICNAAGDAMSRIHRISQRAGRNMFGTGWIE